MIATVLSLALAAVFFVAAVAKLRSPASFTLAVMRYEVIPPSIARVYASAVPPIELFVALLLGTGAAVRFASCSLLVLLVTFVVGISANVYRKRAVDCHCFGAARSRRVGVVTLLQDVFLIFAAAVTAITSEHWFTPETWSPFRAVPVLMGDGPVPLLVSAAVAAGVVLILNTSPPVTRVRAGYRTPSAALGNRAGERSPN